MEDEHCIRSSSFVLNTIFISVLVCIAFIPQVAAAISLNQDGTCTIVDKQEPTTIIDCKDSAKHLGNQNTIIIDEQEVIDVVVSDSDKTVIAVEGGKHDDTIINYGEIYLQVLNTGTPEPIWITDDKADPYLVKLKKTGSDPDNPFYWFIALEDVPLDAIGIAGNDGNDTITNYGLLAVTATTSLSDELGSAQSYAIGISGGKGDDRLVNEGQLNVTSNAFININDVDFNLLETGDAQRHAMAVAVGMTGDADHDGIINRGDINVSANAIIDTTDVNVALIGGAVSNDASHQARAGAIGLDGGDGHDYILNEDTTTVTATASVNTDDVGISLISALWGESVRAPVKAEAAAIGIEGGAGHDEIDNTGTLTVTAQANTDSLTLDFNAVDISMGSLSTSSHANALGIDGGEGKSEISNSGDIIVGATATANTVDVAFTLVDLTFIQGIANLITGTTALDTSTTALAEATGIQTGFDHDRIVNDGSLGVTATATTSTFGLQMSLDGVSNYTDLEEFADFFYSEPLIDASTTAEAIASGISSGHGHDEIYNLDTLTVTALADVSALELGLDLPIPDLIPPVLPNVDTTEVETAATATAYGIISGEGHDTIHNEGSVWSESTATTHSTFVGVTLPDIPAAGPDYSIPYSLEGNLVDVGARSDTDVLGIGSGAGHDYIYSIGDVTATTDALSYATTVSAAIDYAPPSDDDSSINLLSLEVSMINASTEADASSVGIDTGSGNDELFNAGDVLADSYAEAISVAVDADVQLSQDAILGLDASLTRASTNAQANSVGVQLGNGNDTAHNTGSITARAENYAEAVGVSVGISVPSGDDFGIVGLGGWVSTNTIADTFADGLLGGAGRDDILNDGTITAYAYSNTLSTSVIVDAAATKKGAAVTVAVAEAGSEAEATSYGIRGGQDEDSLFNTDTVNATASSNVDAVSVDVTLALAETGAALSGTAVDSSTRATSNAVGISGDQANDVIVNDGDVTVLAGADATSTSVSISASGTSAGVSLGVSLARGGTKAIANATGISLGTPDEDPEQPVMIINSDHVDDEAGQDDESEAIEYLENNGSITASSTAIADTVAVSAQLGFSGTLFSGGAALVDTTTRANATTDAIAGSQQRDIIINNGSVLANTFADADTSSVGLSLNIAPESVTVSVAITDATATSKAVSTGIAGLGGDDDIINWDTIIANSYAETDAASVAVSLGISYVPLGFSFADTTTRADADAVGMDGGEGNDYLESIGIIDVDAVTDAYGISVSATFVGAAMVGADVTADSSAVGMQGAGGNDILYQSETASLTASTIADATGTTVSAVLVGVTSSDDAILEDNNTTALADSIGLSGGDGSDQLQNLGSVNTETITTATGTSVDVSLAGAVFGENNTTATSRSTGITGDVGGDYTQNVGSIIAQGSATTNGTSVSVALVGATFGEANSEATTYSTGIAGGAGDDYSENTGSIFTDANATASGTSVSAALVGAAFADNNSRSITYSTGIAGDDGNDFILNLNSIHTRGSSTTTGTSVGVSLVGAAFSDANTTARSYSTGLDGGAGMDYLENIGGIHAEAYSNATGTSVSAALVGAALADLYSVAEADATGMASGADEDKVFNSGMINVNAYANANGTSVAAGLIGGFEVDASTRINASATGIDLGDGADRVLNEGDIDIAADSSSSLNSVSVSLIGEATAQADITAYTDALGIAGGAGDDLMVNIGSISVGPATEGNPWMSRLVADSFSFSLIGLSDAQSEIYAWTQSTGLDGGDGNDQILNEGYLDITASSYSSSSSTSYSIIGSASAGGAINTDATAIGMNAGEGKDLLVNEGGIDVLATTSASTASSSLSIFGSANSSAGILGTATATGMVGGGDEGDEIVNSGWIDVLASSSAIANGDSFSLIGGATSDAFITADANANGIIGSQGDDKLYNNGSINVIADSTTMAGQEASVALAGGVASGSDTTANAIARGMDASDGNDSISNDGNIDVSASASGDAESRSYTGVFEGDGDSDSHGSIAATGIGIELATGDNTLNNTGYLLVAASSLMDTYADADGANFVNGDAVSIADSIAGSFVYGVRADMGNNQIQNNGDITLVSETDAISYAHADSDEWLGTGVGTAYSYATNGEVSPVAVGIRLGDGNHHIENYGLIALDVSGSADSYAEGDGDAAWAQANANASASMTETVSGIQVGDGDHYIYNKGNIIVEASVHTFAHARTNPTGDPDGSGNSDAWATASVEGTGITMGYGRHEIVNAGDITVRSQANPDASPDNRDAYAHGDGDLNTGTADIIVNTSARSRGISGNAYDSFILNLGDILVDSQANASPYALAGSDASGDAYATGSTTVNAYSKGIVLNGDDNRVTNDGHIMVNTVSTAESIAYTTTWGTDADAIIPTNDSNINAMADGLLVTGNNNTIYNLGRIEVTANTNGQARSESHGGWWPGGDARAYATATAGAFAYGIRSDDLTNDSGTMLGDFIVNKGEISVTADATAYAHSYAEEDNSQNREVASSIADASANSYGIYSANGNDTIINRGLIDVTANVSASVYAETEDGETEIRIINTSSEAVGIYAGEGDDIIEQMGTILTFRTFNGDPTTGTAIDTGPGNDTVFLTENSSTTGDIVLGDNDDIIHIIYTPEVNGRIYGGSGIDTVVYFGSGTFENPLQPDFENTIKKGEGTYTLDTLPPMQTITVQQGVLEINGDYYLPAGGTFMPSVSSGEEQGKLVINGAMNISAGMINIMKGRGHHIDGDQQVVLHVENGINNSISFDNIRLPEETPLLSFSQEITTNDIMINTVVQPFMTVATNDNEKAIADYLENILPTASGRVSETLGEVQATVAGGHRQAFRSLSPEAYANTQQAVSLGTKQYTTTLSQRTRGLRNLQVTRQFTQPGFFTVEQSQPLFSMQQTDSLDGVLSARQRGTRQYGSWFKSYRQDGQLDASATNTGFDFDMTGFAFGFDNWINQQWVVGGSMAQNSTDLNIDGASSFSDINSQLFSFYATYMNDAGYLEGTLSYGSNDYATRRDVVVGPVSATVISEHSGDVYAASFGGGLYFPVSNWKLDLYGNLNYQQQDEEGFREVGAGGISLDVAARSTDLLSSEAGLRFGKHLDKRYSSWFTELGLAWVHDFRTDQAVQASFIDAQGASFTVEGQQLDQDGIVFSAGLNYSNKRGFTGAAEYRTEQRGDYSDQVIFGYITYQFD